MITSLNATQLTGTGALIRPDTLVGLSTDTKPDNVGNGSAFIEMDTGKIYFFNAAEGGGWIEWGA